ncbi:hypothetical protein BBJ28_00016580 [Nothophytophthora sp. Chile5]|nr:hypothetical protein BBJ28_00016580 [Nothophytophthora sp. Chile5]
MSMSLLRPSWGWLQPALAVGLLLLAATCIPSDVVAHAVRLLLLAGFVLVCLDVALTRYHRRRFDPSKPEPRAKRFALVTGASSGLGREMAYLLAERGYSLVLTARSKAVLERIQTEIEAIHETAKVVVCACDLSSAAGIAELVASVNGKELEVDILVNCAGFSLTKDFTALSLAQVTQLMALDMAAVAELSHAFVPQMVARGVGRVLNMGSMAGSVVSPSAALYSSAKAFVMNFSQALDYELRGSGVTVTCFCPGPVHTNFGAAADCDRAIYMNIPGTACSPKVCAALALQAMFSGQTLAYDSWFASISALLAQCVCPRRLLAAVCAVCMNEPSRIGQMLRS